MPSRRSTLVPCCCFGSAIFMKPLGRMPLLPAKFWTSYSPNAEPVQPLKLNWQDFRIIHSIHYLPKLVRAGHRVAICDQLEDPRFVKGIVKRGVTELVTPGLSFNDNVLERKQNNFLASIFMGKNTFGVSFLDVSTGEFYAAQGSENYVLKFIQGFAPSEIIFSKQSRGHFEILLGDEYSTFALDEWVYGFDYAYEKLINQFKTASLKGFWY